VVRSKRNQGLTVRSFMPCLIAAAAMFLTWTTAAAEEAALSDTDSWKTAYIIYTCNTWGYIKPCST